MPLLVVCARGACSCAGYTRASGCSGSGRQRQNRGCPSTASAAAPFARHVPPRLPAVWESGAWETQDTLKGGRPRSSSSPPRGAAPSAASAVGKTTRAWTQAAALGSLRTAAAARSGEREPSAPRCPPRTASAPLPRAPALATRHASPTGAARHPAGPRRHRRWHNGERTCSALGRGFTCFGSQCCAGSGGLTGTRGKEKPAPCSPPGPPARPNAPRYFGGQKSERALRKGRTAEGLRQPLRRGQAASPAPGDGVQRGRLGLLRRVYRKHTQNKTKTAPGAS